MRKISTLAIGLLLVPASSLAVLADQPLQGGVEQKQQMDTMEGGASSYPAPQMVPIPAKQAPMPHHKPLKAAVQDNQAPPPSRPLQATITKVALPWGFMGAWHVQGQRTKVDALPEFAEGAQKVFALNTDNTWNINGSPGSYSMSNGGMSTQLVVDKVEGGTAFIRYQHPINNTVAQEAIVMSLTPGGAQFNGLERISIIKNGQQPPRAKVTYQLVGQRLR